MHSCFTLAYRQWKRDIHGVFLIIHSSSRSHREDFEQCGRFSSQARKVGCQKIEDANHYKVGREKVLRATTCTRSSKCTPQLSRIRYGDDYDVHR